MILSYLHFIKMEIKVYQENEYIEQISKNNAARRKIKLKYEK